MKKQNIRFFHNKGMIFLPYYDKMKDIVKGERG